MRKSLLSLVAVAAMVAPHLHADWFGSSRVESLDNTAMPKVSKKKFAGFDFEWERPWKSRKGVPSEIGYPKIGRRTKTVKVNPTVEDYDQYVANMTALSAILPKQIIGARVEDGSRLAFVVEQQADGKWKVVKDLMPTHRMLEGFGAPDRVARKKAASAHAMISEYKLGSWDAWEILTTKLNVEGDVREMYYVNTQQKFTVSTDDVSFGEDLLSDRIDQESIKLTVYQYTTPVFQPAK